MKIQPVKGHFYVCFLTLGNIFFIMYVIYCCRWLDYLLSRIVFQAKAFVMNACRDREKAREMITQILHRLDAIDKQQDKVMADLRKYLKERIDDTVQRLSKYLLSAEVIARFTTCHPEIPHWELGMFGETPPSVQNSTIKTVSRNHTGVGRRTPGIYKCSSRPFAIFSAALQLC